MAEQTTRLASAGGDAITVDLIYEDTTMRTVAVLYTNTTPQPASITVIRESNGARASFTVPALSSAVTVALPSYAITVNARGYLLGVAFEMTWPV